jgi:hypothetical protein
MENQNQKSGAIFSLLAMKTLKKLSISIFEISFREKKKGTKKKRVDANNDA